MRSTRQFEAKARRERTRQCLLDAAISIVSKAGFTGLTIAHLAEVSKYSAGTVYKHFESKSVLCVEMYDIAASNELAAIQKILLGPGLASNKISRTIKVFALRAFSNPILAYSLGSEPVEPLLVKQRSQYKQAYVSLFHDVISDGIRTGEIADQNAAVTAAALVGVIIASVIDPLTLPAMLSRDQRRKTIVTVQRFCLGAVLSPA